MPSKKTKQKLMKRRISCIARILACASFLILTIIGVSSLVRAMSLETIANENGIPSSWKIASLGNPDTITVPITYWDQRQDDCTDENRQFEWSQCQLYTTGALQGVVKPYLGADGLPIPAYTNSTDAWNAHRDIFTMNITGHEPVLPTDNFYRWFHETALSKKFTRQITFTRKGNNTYTYGSRGIFPLDDVSFSNTDDATKTGHNFHFTSHLRIPIKLSLDGKEVFSFLGDDDVWVYLNGQLVLDIGGLHQAVSGKFTINQDGSISTYVDSVAQPQNRTKIAKPSTADMNNYQWRNNYLNQVHNNVSAPSASKTINANLKAGDVVNLDFFYAERSTSESNTEITIANMNWPISADSALNAEIVGRIGSTENNLVEFSSSITNRDPENPLNIEHIAAYVEETTESGEQNSGFLPLSAKTLFYSTTPEDENSWQPVEISAPENSANGFRLTTPLRLAPSGATGDTLHFRYFGETSGLNGTMSSKLSYYTSIGDTAGVTYDNDKVIYEAPKAYTVSVKYLYEDDTEAAPTYTEVLPIGGTYDVMSPEITNYLPDITKISGSIVDGNIEYTVYYKRIPEEPTPIETPRHTITVKYIYEDGTSAAESYTEELEEGNNYSINSPSIDTYEPDQAKVEGTIGDTDIEHTVIYRKKEIILPIAPTEPNEPEQPKPEIPTPPTIPSSDIIAGDLLYLAPLGEIAFVPNTGIVSDAVASIFEASFAEIILSQGFVMVVLFIFAGSFATWFSLRKYMNMDLATRTTTKKHPKMPMAKKTIRGKATARNAHATHNAKSVRKAKK